MLAALILFIIDGYMRLLFIAFIAEEFARLLC